MHQRGMHDRTADHPTLSELRAVVQPAAHMARYNAEHWSGALYMRYLSVRVTRLLLPTHITPNGVTWLMVVVGVGGAFALPLGVVTGPVVAVVAMQAQILLDCSDGEVARWRQRFSPAGIYLDRVGHYLTEAALPIALGLRADGWGPDAWTRVGGWTTLGLAIAVLVLLNKAFTDLVHVARAQTGLPILEDAAATARPRAGALAVARSAFRYLPVFRAFVAVEASLLALAAALADLALGDMGGTRGLLTVLLPLALVTAVGHLAAVLSSARLE